MRMRTTFAAALALTSLSTPVMAQVAASTASCITEAEVSALVVYAMPSLIASLSPSCSAHLSSEGFIATGGAALADRYATRSEAVWPTARSAITKFAGSKSTDIAMFANLPDNAIRPLADALIEQMVAAEIKPDSCRDIERFAKVLSVLEPEETGALAAVVVALAVGQDNDVPVCRNPD